jgi:RNA polymerase sigma factor (sigma-70 family)
MSSQIAAMRNEAVPSDAHESRRGPVTEYPLPPVVRSLLDSSPMRDDAWDAFIAEYTHLLLHVSASVPGTRDDRMDAYTRILEALRANDCRRLRGYAAMSHSKFTTWLVVVAKRICIDQHRLRFGRAGAAMSGQRVERLRTRRQLAELPVGDTDVVELASGDERSVELELRQRELGSAVNAALAELYPADRLLIMLRFRDGLSTPEIARILGGTSPLAVYSRIRKLLAALRSALTSRGFDAPSP